MDGINPLHGVGGRDSRTDENTQPEKLEPGSISAFKKLNNIYIIFPTNKDIIKQDQCHSDNSFLYIKYKFRKSW